MLSTPKSKGELFLASSLRDGLEDNDIRQVKTLLLSKEADPNVLIPTHGISPFHLVIGNDSEKFAEEVTKLFLRHGGNPNVRSSDGMTPVHVAAAWGRVAVLELLLANGGDPLCLDDDGRSPFHYAFDGNFYNAVTMLGKYCGMNQDEEEENEPKYKLTLDKILINKGNVVAEYVTSEDSCSVSAKSEWNERFDDVESVVAKLTAKRQDLENRSPSASPGADEYSHLNTNNITLRRYHKRRVVSPPAASVGANIDGSSVEAERLLIGEIISRLSDTCANDSLIVKDSTATSGNPSINEATKSAPEIKKMRSFLPPPRYRSDKANSKEKTPRAESPNLRITNDAKTPTPSKRKIIAPRSSSCKWRDRNDGNATPPLHSARPEARIKGANSTPRHRSEKTKATETPPRRLADTSIVSESPNLRSTHDGKSPTPSGRKAIASPNYTCKFRYWNGGNATPPLRSARIKGTNSTPRYRSEKAKSTETPPRRLVDTSIVSKSPNLRITNDGKSPTSSRRKAIASPSYTCRSRYWNGGNATPPLRSARPEARVKSASSTPKRKSNGSRLCKVPKLTRKAERPIGASSGRAGEVTPTVLDRTYSKDRFGFVTYSPDAELHARGVERLDRRFLARGVAVNLDDRMSDDNRDSLSDSTVEGSSSYEATRRLKPPRIYNNIRAEAASEAGKPKRCNVASGKFKAASPRDPLGKEKVSNAARPATNFRETEESPGKQNFSASSNFKTASPRDPLGNEKFNDALVAHLLTPKARDVEFSPKSKANFRADDEASTKFKAASPHEPLANERVNNFVSRLLTPKAPGVEFSPNSRTNFRAEAERPKAIFDSPGSSRAISVSSIIGRQYRDGDDKEETQHWLEIEEACRSRCVTPPASVSMIVADDSPYSSHTSQTTFYSDYGSEDSYGSDFNEASVNYSTVVPTTRMTSVSRSESFVSVEEEYTYEDAEEGVVFVERRLCVIPSSARDDWNPVKNEGSLIDRFDDLSIAASDRTSIDSQSEPLSRSMLDDEILRARLTALGEQPGPITKTTYDVYLKRLWRLERDRKRTPGKPVESPKETRKQIDRVVLVSAIPDFLLATDWTTKLEFYQSLEQQAFKEYATANPTRKYRGGISKTSFCYLLLDPRVTRDLPRSSSQLSVEERWKRFLEGVFYVGQGKAARPAHHLYDAFGVWSKRKRVDNINRKIRRILDIWEEGQGIVCLHVFYHTMVEEACSREASMIDALDTTHLTNCNRGTYYGYTTTMSAQEKRSLGKYLLYKAMEIFMHEGERQLFPRNVTM